MSDIDAAAAPEVDKPDNEVEAPGAPGQAEPSSGEDSFTEFDPSQIPDTASPEWLKEQYDHMRGDYTRKMQEFGETRRDREQLQEIFDGIKGGDPATIRSYLNLMGVDQQAVLEAYDLEMAEAEEAAQQGPQFEDELDFRDPRVDRLEQERQAERAEAQTRQQEAEAEQYADELGSRMETELTELNEGKEPSEDEARLVFNYALEHRDRLGNPDVKAGYKWLNDFRNNDRQAWLDSRNGPRAPMSGIPGSTRHDTSTKEGRIAAMAEAAQEAMSSQ